MRIIIDGYNLIRRVPELAELDRSDMESGREVLLKSLSEYRSTRRIGITVVFDGAGAVRAGRGRKKVVGIDVLFSAPGESADAVLRELASRMEADLLVSADREVRSACEARGLTVIGPEEFWNRVESERMRLLKGEEPGEEVVHPPRPAGRRLSKRRRRDMRRLSRL